MNISVLELACSPEQFDYYTVNYFVLRSEFSVRFQHEIITPSTQIRVYVKGDQTRDVTLNAHDIWKGSRFEIEGTLSMETESGLLLPNPYIPSEGYRDLLTSILHDDKQALVLTHKDSGRVLAASARYCSFTKSFAEWQVDSRNNKRWESSMLARLYDDYLDRDGMGSVTRQYEYRAKYCNNEAAGPIQWISDFQEGRIGGAETRVRLARVRFVEGVFDDLQS